MKQTRLLFAVLCSVLICACSPNEPNFPNSPSTGGTSSETETKPTASFTYIKQQPLKIVFTNNSKDAKSYVWDFGDGTTSTETNPIHKYKTKGVYKVVLTAKNTIQENKISQNITIEEPTNIYLKDITLNNVPDNEYYYVKITHETGGLFSSTKTDYTSETVLLSSANLPKTFYPTNSIKFEGYEYKVSIYQKTSKNASASRVCTTTIIPSVSFVFYLEEDDYVSENYNFVIHYNYK